MKAYSERYYVIINRNNQKIIKVINAKDYLELTLIKNYDIQDTC